MLQQLGMQGSLEEMKRQNLIRTLTGGGQALPQAPGGGPQGGIVPADPSLINLALTPGGGPLANLISTRQIAAGKQGLDREKYERGVYEWENLSANQKAELAQKGIRNALDLAEARDKGIDVSGISPAVQQPMGTVAPPQPGTPEHQAYQAVASGQVPTAYVPQTAPAAQAPIAMPGLSPRGAREAAEAAAKKEAEERAKLRVEMPEARQQVQIQNQDLDRLAGAAIEIINRNLARSTGALGAMPSFPGGKAAQVESLVTSLKAQVSGMKLQAMRNASKTGGAVGQVTEKEWPRLENMIVALDPVKMGPEMFRKKLWELVNEINKVKGSIEQAFSSQYGGTSGTQSPAGDAYSDPEKERRYQEYKKRHGG